jgi:hypothetical protein
MRRMHHSSLYPAVVAGAVVVGLMASNTPARAADKAAMGTETLSIYDTGWSSEKTERLALNLGQLLVARINRAKQLVDDGDLATAQNAILEAEGTADVIVNISPIIAVTDSVRDARNRLVAEGAEAFADSLILVNGNVDRLEVFAPKLAKSARARLNTAEEKAQANDTRGAVVELQEVADEMSSTTFYLPVGHAYNQLAVARLALAQKTPDVATAKKAIDSALEVVAVKVDAIDAKTK